MAPSSDNKVIYQLQGKNNNLPLYWDQHWVVQTQPECRLHLQSYTCPLVGVKSYVKECNMAMHIILKDKRFHRLFGVKL